MAHRLALAIGELDVDRILDELPVEKLKQWIAYFRLEPWGAELHRTLTSIMCATFANAMGGKKDGQPFQPADFPIEFGPEDEDSSDWAPRMDAEQMMAAMAALGANFKKIG